MTFSLAQTYALSVHSGLVPPESEFDFDANEEQVGVIVWENRFAEVPLPRELFQGDYDARWGLDRSEIKRIYEGDGLLAFEALDALDDPT